MKRVLLALLGLGLFPASAAAGPVVAVKGAAGPGPARYGSVSYERFGPASAKRVLILVPGTQGGAGDFSLVGPEIARRVKGLQVWAYDRRSQALEDHTGFATGDPDRAFGYYLRGEPVGGRTFAPVDGASVPYVRDWGLKLALEDLRQVVRRARRGGRRVILGGHSLGASMAVAYAAWDFGGRAGHRDLSGLVLIDGGLLGSFTSPQLAGVRQRLAALQTADPFLDLLGVQVPWAAGVLSATAGMYARLRPDARATLTDFPLLPASLRPPVPVTNEAGLGYAFDHTTSPAALALIQVRAGRLATTGDPRPWQDGEVSPIQRVARLFGRSPVDATEWYFPTRLSLDVDGASGLARNAVTKLLGLREFHRRSIDLPLYALQTDLTGGRVLRGARRLIASSRIPARRAKLVDASRTNSHLDPLTSAPARSTFLKTVIPFLRRTR
ncbi:MAG: alpha/beta hydrolase [Solirubrobacteraceae bacterium]